MAKCKGASLPMLANAATRPAEASTSRPIALPSISHTLWRCKMLFEGAFGRHSAPVRWPLF